MDDSHAVILTSLQASILLLTASTEAEPPGTPAMTRCQSFSPSATRANSAHRNTFISSANNQSSVRARCSSVLTSTEQAVRRSRRSCCSTSPDRATPADTLKPLAHQFRHAILVDLARVPRVPGPKNAVKQKPATNCSNSAVTAAATSSCSPRTPACGPRTTSVRCDTRSHVVSGLPGRRAV